MKSLHSRTNLISAGIVFVLLLVCSALFVTICRQQKELNRVHRERYESYVLATQLRRSSDELTRLVRTYAATGSPRFEQQFWQVLAIRNGEAPRPTHYDHVYWDFLAVPGGQPPEGNGPAVSLKDLMIQANISPEEMDLLEEAQRQSDELVAMEMMAMDALKGHLQDETGRVTVSSIPDPQQALDLLHGQDYHQAKIAIMKPINAFYERLDARTEKQTLAAAARLHTTLIILIVVIGVMLLLLALSIITDRRHHRRLIGTLNRKVGERTENLRQANVELQKALDEIQTLHGIIPICSACHRIRNEEGAWDRLEAYISAHSAARFTHGLCPTCFEEAAREADRDMDEMEGEEKMS